MSVMLCAVAIQVDSKKIARLRSSIREKNTPSWMSKLVEITFSSFEPSYCWIEVRFIENLVFSVSFAFMGSGSVVRTRTVYRCELRLCNTGLKYVTVPNFRIYSALWYCWWSQALVCKPLRPHAFFYKSRNWESTTWRTSSFSVIHTQVTAVSRAELFLGGIGLVR